MATIDPVLVSGPHSMCAGVLANRRACVWAIILAALAASGSACVTDLVGEGPALEDLSWWMLSLDGDRFVYAPITSATASTTKPTYLLRGVVPQDPKWEHEWEDVREEIRRLGRMGNAMLMIYRRSKHEPKLEMIKKECEEAGVVYGVSWPTGSLIPPKCGDADHEKRPRSGSMAQ